MQHVQGLQNPGLVNIENNDIGSAKFYKIIMSVTFGVMVFICLIGIISILIGIILPDSLNIESINLVIVVQICTVVISSYIALFMMYCKFSGLPFKKEFLKEKVKHILIVFLIWSGGFLFKIILQLIGVKLFLESIIDFDNNVFKQLILILYCLVTEIIPYILVLDAKFI